MVKKSTSRPAPALLDGLVAASFGRQFLVEVNETIIPCVTHGKKGGVACGDHVQIALTGAGQGVIEKILPRASLLYRSDQFREKIIAANVTQIIIVLAAVPSYYEDLLNRCLAAAEISGIKALIVLNKSDMIAESAAALAQLQLFRDLGYTVLLLSATHDITPLRPYLENQVSVLVGQSGMGKSSIINALLPHANSSTREISSALDSGRHTTTHARLYHLNANSHIIDSPGLQEFGLRHFSASQLVEAFVEFRPYLGHCKFSNCLHLTEPGCAVLAARAAGIISERRHAAYQRLIGEVSKRQEHY